MRRPQNIPNAPRPLASGPMPESSSTAPIEDDAARLLKEVIRRQKFLAVLHAPGRAGLVPGRAGHGERTAGHRSAYVANRVPLISQLANILHRTRQLMVNRQLGRFTHNQMCFDRQWLQKLQRAHAILHT